MSNIENSLLSNINAAISQMSFIKLSPGLTQFERIRMGHANSIVSETLESAFGIDAMSRYNEMLVNQLTQSLINKVVGKILDTKSVDFIEVKDTDLDYNLPPQLVTRIAKHRFKNMVVSTKMATSIADSVGCSNYNYRGDIRSLGATYEIAKFLDYTVWVDPFMKYNDNRILLFDDVYLNIGDCSIYEEFDTHTYGPRNIANIEYQILVNNSLVLYVINDRNDPMYGEYLSVMRDEKIDSIFTDNTQDNNTQGRPYMRRWWI